MTNLILVLLTAASLSNPVQAPAQASQTAVMTLTAPTYDTEIEIDGRRRHRDPVADLRAAGLEPPRVEPREELQVLAPHRIDHRAVHFLFDDEVVQSARGEEPDAKAVAMRS